MADSMDLEERLTPSHLVPGTEEELKEMAETVKNDSEKEPSEDPRNSEEYQFKLNFVDGRGRSWQGVFVNKILSIQERQTVGIMRARLTGGYPFSSLDPSTVEINHIVTHLTMSLKKRPKWAENLLSLTNIEILQAIFMEVDSHESYFHGYLPIKGGSTEKSG